MAVAAIRLAFEITMDYVGERTAFGRPIVDRCITELHEGQLTAEVAAMAKWPPKRGRGWFVALLVEAHRPLGFPRDGDGRHPAPPSAIQPAGDARL